ncbi:hypothetical protein BJ973_000408 [Actinoplanes tereljensis]|uniref:Uncharacterized protein n=1 Tax=Paractinoplanes tereljensis TaxID=571912 RepID=A0A919NQH6_9ACTN|nr:hypothetical protein [Actinoplanes tereljensis]GIF23236.1 hypothetical protein Ate02nite_59660 [Actinoplanes tereljensis]
MSHYRLRVGGHLDQHWSSSFGGLTLTREDDGTTSLTGAVTDQAELHGLLSRIRDLGVTLVSVEVIDVATEQTDRPNRPVANEPLSAPLPRQRS